MPPCCQVLSPFEESLAPEPRGQAQRPRRIIPREAAVEEKAAVEVEEAVAEVETTTTATGQCALPIPLLMDALNNAVYPQIAELNLRPMDMSVLPLGGNTCKFLMIWETRSIDRENMSR